MNRKNRQEQKITALYCRLSLEDGKDNESMSISNQKLLLKDYAEKNGLFNYEYYVDDGYSGRNFNRPGFRRMVSDIEKGLVSCVITKDLSRLGRNYIEAGSYIEIFFPKHNVRYIAVTDGVDSLNNREMDITPFKNILNDMYSRDISKKVLAGRMTRSRQGKFCGGPPPFGLKRDPEDRGHLIIDEETAPVIREIYGLALDGWGTMRISKRLMQEKVPITRVIKNTEYDINYYSWANSRVVKILRNPVYKGAHVVCKTHQKAIRSNTYNFIPRDEWEVIEDCHEPIIGKTDWARVQELMDRRPVKMTGNKCPYENIFHGIICCADCGKSMQARYEKIGRTDVNRTTKQKREPIDKSYYICQTYNRLGKNACTSHKIEARALHDIVLADIRELAAVAVKDTDAFYARLSGEMEKRFAQDGLELQKEYDRLVERNREIDEMFLNLYADKAKGIITEQRFLKLTEGLETEQEQNNSRMRELAEMLHAADEKENDIRDFVDGLRKYGTITELDETVLNRLVDRVVIGKPEKINGERVQEVRIVYNFVGEVSAAGK